MKRVFLTLMVLALAGCGDPTSADPRKVTFAPELGIDLDAMVRTSSGLYYQDLEVGDGAAPVPGRSVAVLYKGWLPDGTLFDQRQDPENPFRFRVGIGMVIAGWDEGVLGMREGGVRKLVIPPSLAYGDRAVGSIPANSVLVFEVRLLSAE